MLRILIVEGNTREAREATLASGAPTQSALYEQTLLSLRPAAWCEVVYPADDGAWLPDGPQLENYDGIVWTGSSLNIYQDDPANRRQIDFMKRCFERRVKIFGSCWGLQVAVVAAGGEVQKNIRGREIGIARDIQPTASGRQHPLYRDKTVPFDAVAIHLDHVVRLPEGATVLSGNEMSRIQAIEIRRGPAIFWGVQYHPEFDLDYIAALLQKYKRLLVEEGICADETAVDHLSADYRQAQQDDSRADIRARHDISPDVLEPKSRLREIENWLEFIESPTA